MKQAVFKPLQMNSSTFHWSDTAEFELAAFYDRDSSIAPHYKYTALAAASLYTNLADFELFLKAHLSSNNGVLNDETITMMSQPNAKIFGIDVYGLGTMVFGENIIGHDGNNRPAINTSARLNLSNGDGIIILQTGSNWFASEMGSEWVFWNTGQVDLVAIQKSIEPCVNLVVIGWGVITLLSFFLIRRSVKKGRRKGNTK